MDHLTDDTSLKSSVQVPLLQTPTYTPLYDSQGFYEYPDRQGWVAFEFLEEGNFTQSGTRSPEEAACFLQAWLFFGCLAEYLGDTFNYSDFVEPGADGRALVNTKTLHQLLRDRRETFLRDPQTLRTCLGCLQGQFGVFFTLSRYAALFDPDHKFFDKCPVSPEVALSIIILGETLEYHLTTVLDNVQLPYNAIDFNVPYKAELPMSLLRENNWCNGEILVCRRNYSASILMLMTCLGKRAQQRSHSRCNPTGRCRALDIDEATYETKHTRNECRCSHLALQIDILHDIIQNQNNVVVDATRQCPTTWQYSPSQNAKFVAISHIWSDGLGNPTANSLPLCQMQLLKERVAALYKGTTANITFWIDTLCVPVDSNLRKQAISQMKDVYEHADAVLILDAELLNVTLPDGAIWDMTEYLLRLCSSNWWRRLWTLQEGVEAKEIYFQFHNRCISLRHIFDDLISKELDSYIKKVHLRILAEMWLNIRWNSYRMIEKREPIRLIWNAVQFRVPSKISDETICLGSLLGFGPEDIQSLLSIPGTEPKKRMQKFLLLQRHFPVDVLFLPGTKLIEKPFRWAPTSFIFSGHSDDDIDILGTDFSPMSGPLCTVDINGLSVSLTGFKLFFDEPYKVSWGNLNANRPRRPVLLLLKERYEKDPSCVLVDFEEEIDGVSYVSNPLNASVVRLPLDWEDRSFGPKDRLNTLCKGILRSNGNTADFENPHCTWSYLATGTKLEERNWCVR
ncbi:MAG: hypothetical protein M1827_004564 [Pycnora praestabilis]|nr:MAG: hypothetical protein M1827_004564 [Pycnora praestabilis]